MFQALILGAICILAFMCRLFSVVRYESVIHEFDPWFNFRTTRYLVAEGFYNFHNWFDEGSWYPLGRFIGGTLYPGLMWTAAAGYHFLHLLHFTVDIRNVCVLLAPFMAGNTAIATYLLTKECWNGSAGIYAAIFVGIAPGVHQSKCRGVLRQRGLRDLRSRLLLLPVGEGSEDRLYAVGCDGCVGLLLHGGLMGWVHLHHQPHPRSRLPPHPLRSATPIACTSPTAHSTHFGTLLSMQIAFVSFQPVSSPEHLVAFAVFGLLQLYNAFYWLQSLLPASDLKMLGRYPPHRRV